jgi:hypothetical protein
MKRQSIIVAGALVIALGLGAGHVLSQEGGKHGEKPGEKQGEKPAGGETDMQAMMKLHEPGPHHKRLQALVGDWDVVSKMYMDPSQPPHESKAKAKYTSLHGGRFIVQSYEGDFAGTPFIGHGMSGFDNETQKHVGLWTDSTSTTLYIETGTCDGECKVITETGESTMGGQKYKMKGVTKIKDADHFSFEMFTVGPDGADMKNMELQYTRKK